ncbi:unnamed protein product [Closterium sp. Naga37s-1]|nr:unnamed protein product [Closterium sp. Naga37s-1]
MGGSRTFQAVLLIPTDDNQLYPLTSDELPRVLLPVGGRPLLSYNLELLESCNVQSVLLVIVGADSAAASRISGWVAQNFHERLPGLEIAVVSEAVGSADALRSIFHRIADVHDLLVLFADVLTDVPLGSVAAAHRREDAALTIVFNDRDGLAGGSDGAAGGTGSGGDARSGDKGKKGGASGGGSGGKSGGGGKAGGKSSAVSPDLVGLDASGKRLLIFQPGSNSAGSAPRQTALRRALLETEGRVDLCTDLIDSRVYAFRRTALQNFLASQSGLSCLRRDVLPAFVRDLQPRRQLLLASLLPPSAGLPFAASAGTVAGLVSPAASAAAASGGGVSGSRDVLGSGRGGNVGGDAEGSGGGGGGGGGGADSAAAAAAAAAAGAGAGAAGGGAGGGGAAAGKAAAAVHESVSLAAKATIGPHCMVGEGTSVGEKSSIKRSIIGRHCRIGAHVKLVNSVIMDHVTIGDGCLVQGSVVSSNVLMQERTSVVDCYVGPGFVVGKDYKESELSKKPKAQAAQS